MAPRVLPERHHAALNAWATRHGAPALLLSCFIPVVSFNLINYAAGLTAISWWTFTWATGLLILPLTFLVVLMGHGLPAADSHLWLCLLAACFLWPLWHLLTRRPARPLVDLPAER